MLNLVTDRTIANYDEAIKFMQIPVNELTDEQKLEWVKDALQSSLAKGKYDHTDLNRVANAIYYIKRLLLDNGYELDIQIKNNWVIGDIPTKQQLEYYLQKVKITSSFMGAIKTQLPDNMVINVEDANNIEKALLEVEGKIENLIKYGLRLNAFNFYSGKRPL